MWSLTQSKLQSDQSGFRPESADPRRSSRLNILFIHRDANTVECCLQELKKAQFTVSADVALNLAQCKEQLRSQSYDVVVAEYPSPSWKGSQGLHFLRQTVKEIPLLFVTTSKGTESIAELTAHGAFDYVEGEHIAQLPMAVRRTLNETKLRVELEEAGKALRHSQSLYHALVDNPEYGVCRCDVQGKFLDVNQALVNMLGYATKEELLAANYPSDGVFNFGKGSALAGRSSGTMRINPIEIEWKRKNNTTLKVRLSGRGIYDDHGDCVGHEIIAVDITEQRTLEEQLRHQASSDSLTGLANHRRLFDALHAEICRSKRTMREFSLVLLDLDGLKDINDRYGHLAGDRALCRLAHILTDCCRSVDTAARQGGDEFALILPETDAAAAMLVGQRICGLVAKDAEEPRLSVSVGVSSFPKDAETIGNLLFVADRVLYAMKDKRVRAAWAGPVS
ncbi:MAG TPA: diguanylate cyclase [Candidatus Dormibacteraeota bacterium]|nr:diguanylate cyclase [Candidatus Dormibacteraeota bacterium]